MHVVWLRPDGFHGAVPTDYKVVELGGAGRLWLHKEDTDGYPFRVSGGWEDEDASKKLNGLVNLISQDAESWVVYLRDAFSHSMGDDPAKFYGDLGDWLIELDSHVKGDSWEVDIIRQAFVELKANLGRVEPAFMKSYGK